MRTLQLTWFCWSCAAGALLVSVGLDIVSDEGVISKPEIGIASIVFGTVLFLLAQVSQIKTKSFRRHDKEV